ncbi:LVIVD repeat-containing protein [Pontibacter ummariensis]|uniref:LVIVD repeat-containing protein n=1 Tax=Pontibacter ummariensis TaxID=1610492 RepID=A0A239C8D2_9BACT|nr:hypothetical protein [Pontibacter ummariensis]PRY15415.1 LVIVD repeat-containing protein [Pontibacter ummariensis]SNS15881.1 LVIVD repeat-containing protein [Pontibacter ummariensis]
MKNRKASILLLLAWAVTALTLSSCESDMASPVTDVAQGQGGSMARFAISGDHLYTVDHSSLNLFDISDPANPRQRQEVPLSFGIETIFPFQDKLFIGTQTGMHIYSIQTPAAPKHLSHYEHVVSCDPVVTDGRYAYITLRTGTACRQAINQLQIVDLQNILDPVRVQQYDMTNPKGLGIDRSTLFVCDDGLKVYDASDVMAIQLKQHFPINAYDVIPDNGRLLVIGSDGFYQYQYHEEELELLSTILVEPSI